MPDRVTTIEAPSFFRTMFGATADREVRVSRAFAGCFSESKAFRRAVLGVICRSPALESPTQQRWRCEIEVPVEGGRLDIRLVPENVHLPILVLESKVAAVLTAAQLSRYRSSSDSRTRLIAITKRYPEVGRKWLRENKCAMVRWQDIHHALADVRTLRGPDRFLCVAFRNYLEELDMAHRDALTQTDIAGVTKLFAAIQASRNTAMDAQAAFRAGRHMLLVLEEVLRDARDERPELERWKRWGPSYQKWRNEDGSASHNFHFRLLKRGWKQWMGAGFTFGEGEREARWVVQGIFGDREFYRGYKIEKISARNHSLDPERMLRLFLSGLNASGLLADGARAS